MWSSSIIVPPHGRHNGSSQHHASKHSSRNEASAPLSPHKCSTYNRGPRARTIRGATMVMRVNTPYKLASATFTSRLSVTSVDSRFCKQLIHYGGEDPLLWSIHLCYQGQAELRAEVDQPLEWALCERHTHLSGVERHEHKKEPRAEQRHRPHVGRPGSRHGCFCPGRRQRKGGWA